MRTYIRVTVARTPYTHGYLHALPLAECGSENGGGGRPTGREHDHSTTGPGGAGAGGTPPPFWGEIGCGRGRVGPLRHATRVRGARDTTPDLFVDTRRCVTHRHRSALQKACGPWKAAQPALGHYTRLLSTRGHARETAAGPSHAYRCSHASLGRERRKRRRRRRSCGP